jgi:hypothetical protein
MARTRFRGHQRRWLLSLIGVLVVIGAGWLLSVHMGAGDMAPAFTLPSTTGGTVALDQYRGRQPVVLVFYMGEF